MAASRRSSFALAALAALALVPATRAHSQARLADTQIVNAALDGEVPLSRVARKGKSKPAGPGMSNVVDGDTELRVEEDPYAPSPQRSMGGSKDMGGGGTANTDTGSVDGGAQGRVLVTEVASIGLQYTAVFPVGEQKTGMGNMGAPVAATGTTSGGASWRCVVGSGHSHCRRSTSSGPHTPSLHRAL